MHHVTLYCQILFIYYQFFIRNNHIYNHEF
jgi:hypothetical protein